MVLSIPFCTNLPIAKNIRCMVFYRQMNDIQARIAQFEEKGWTLASLADELGVAHNTVEKWKAGDRQPANSKATFAMMDRLIKQKRIPKKRRYTSKREAG